MIIRPCWRWAAIGMLALIGAAGSGAKTTVWSSGDGDWETGPGWSEGMPGAGDHAVIEGGTVLLTNETAELASLTMTGGMLMFSNWTARLAATNVLIQGTASLSHVPNWAAATNELGEWPLDGRIRITCTDLFLDTHAVMHAAGRGFAGGPASGVQHGRGPGRGLGDGTGPGGGGHGGKGGTGYLSGKDGNIYGLTNAPVLPGSGGGSASGAVGGNGGGAVRIDAGGTVVINGTINANALPGSGGRHGGGSGGSIFITCQAFAGTNGLLTADGASGSDWSGRGGGGRIAVVAGSGATPPPTVRFSTRCGITGHPATDGDIGTLFFTDTALLDGAWMPHNGAIYFDQSTEWNPDRLVVTGGWIRIFIPIQVTNDAVIASSTGRIDLLENLHVGGDFTLTNGASLYAYSRATNDLAEDYGILVAVTGTLTVAAGCTVYPACHPTDGGSPLFRAQSLDIGNGGIINADGRGFKGGDFAAGHGQGWGPGGGYNASWTGSGGSHGGRGTRSLDAALTRAPYGSAEPPFLPGSGGGSRNAGYGGNGGGLVRVLVADAVTVNGTITANGSGGGFGGGSGGSIHIQCETIEGHGLIRADGQDQSYNIQYANGGGGGGRIAIVYNPAAQAALPAVPALVFSARGGTGGTGLLSTGARALVGDIGTLYFPDSAFVTNEIPHNGRFVIPGFTAWSVPYIRLLGSRAGFETDGLQIAVAGDVSGTNDRIMLEVCPNSTVTVGGHFLAGAQIQAGGALQVGGDMRLTNAAPYYSRMGPLSALTVGGDLVLAEDAANPHVRLEIEAGLTNGTTVLHGAVVNVAGALQLGSNAWVFLAGDGVNGGQPFFDLGHLHIANRAGFNGDAGGFGGGYGPGAGGTRQGGSHGGLGGAVTTDKTYGVSNAPVLPGSGAGPYQVPGGPGGGLVRIEVERAVTLDGTITVNGRRGSGAHSSGGSGGGIYLQCDSLAGESTGRLLANGGDGAGSAGYAMGGGGGRIAVWRNPAKDTFAGLATAAGGLGAGGGTYNGQPGTVVWGESARSGGALIILR